MNAQTFAHPGPALRTRDLAVGYRRRREQRAVLERVSVSVDA